MKKSLTAILIFLAALFAVAPDSARAAINEAQAKEIALKHAGLSAQEVLFTKVKLDRELTHTDYELEFYAGNVEYEYDIDIDTSEIHKFSRKVKKEAPRAGQSGTAAQNPIGEAKAIEIALARVPGATSKDVAKLKLEYDDGIEQYEGKIFYNRREYEFEIDARTGEVLKWELDD